MLSLRVHNALDYLLALVLIACPFVSGMSAVPAALTTFIAAGLSLVFYSLLTDYALSARRIIPVIFHRALDLMVGLFILIAPALYGYRTELTIKQYLLHISLGLATIGLAAFTHDHKPQLQSILSTEAEDQAA